MDGREGVYRPRSASSEVKNMDDFEVKIAPDGMNGLPATNGLGKENMAAAEVEGERADNNDER